MKKKGYYTTTTVAENINQEILYKIFAIAGKFHTPHEWFLVYKPNGDITKVEDGNDNVLMTAPFKIEDTLYSQLDHHEDEDIITVVYPHER
jgi:hypothetical protein